MTIFCNQLILLSLIIDGQSINYKGSEHKSLSSIGHWLSIPIDWLIHRLVSIVTDYQFHWLVTSIAVIMLTLEISQQDRIECKKQIDLYFFTHLPWQHCQNSLWIQSAVTLGVHGYLTMVGWKFMINNRTQTEAHLWIIPELKTYRLN